MGYSTWTLMRRTTVDEYLTEVFGASILDYEIVGPEIYAAMRLDDGIVLGVVILPHSRPMTAEDGTRYFPAGRTVADQTIGEEEGPYYYGCPRRILDQLTPLEDWTRHTCCAPTWRAAVAERRGITEEAS